MIINLTNTEASVIAQSLDMVDWSLAGHKRTADEIRKKLSIASRKEMEAEKKQVKP